MGAEYWWFMCSLNKEQEKKIKKIFEEKFKMATKNNLYFDPILQSELIVDFRSRTISNNNLIAYDKFISMFDIYEFHELGEKIIDDSSILNEDNCLKFMTFDRCPPFALIYYGLGGSISQNIIGFRGNIFIDKTKVNKSYFKIHSIFHTQKYESVRERASKLVMNPACLDELDDILRALPNYLCLAKNKNLGFLSIAMRGI